MIFTKSWLKPDLPFAIIIKLLHFTEYTLLFQCSIGTYFSYISAILKQYTDKTNNWLTANRERGNGLPLHIQAKNVIIL
jgi:hypothetical protein